MEERFRRPFFEEEQRFPAWIRAIVLLPVFGFGCLAILSWFLRGEDLGLLRILFGALALLSLLGALSTFTTRLVTELDPSELRLRIHPQKWSVLPRRMTRKDVALGEIRRWEVRTYDSLLSSEYWGWHFWGLAVAKGGRYLYVMRPSSPVSGRGVQLWLSSGERVLVGSERPEELEDAISMAKNASR